MHYPSYAQDLQYRYEFSGNFIQYEGIAPASAKESDAQWIIKKYYNDGTNITKIVFANRGAAFDKVWNNRTGYSYG